MEKQIGLSTTLHFIYMDIVGFSAPKIFAIDQVEKMNQLNRVVSESKTYQTCEPKKRIALPTGDGMVIGFEESCEQPYNLALEITEALNEYNKGKKDEHQIKLRIGLHTGAVFWVLDINGNQNLCGNGIILTQRVMDIGEAGHILASNVIAEELKKIRPEYYSRIFKVVGKYEIKHEEYLHIHNIYDEKMGIGNPSPPEGRYINLMVTSTPEGIPFTITKVKEKSNGK